jgi:tRNA threonylcarbamoyladenosine biosynthesis protein TsaE
MTRHRTASAAETEALGERIARGLGKGSVVGLSGDLGAGKTAFVRGFARGVGCTGRAHSPTFALLNEYPGGRCRLFHLDLYRLHGPDDIRGAGLDEYLVAPDGIAVVEWIERWCGNGPCNGIRRLRFETVDESTRDIFDDDPGT